MWVLQTLGFTINWEKYVVTPTQQIQFLGLVTDSRLIKFSLPGEKLRQIRGEALKILSQPLASARTLSQLIGKLNVAAQAVVLALLFYRHLQGSLKSALASGSHGYDNAITLVSRGSGRAYLVAAASQDMEWQMPPQGSRAGDNSLRCLPIGLGNNMRGHSDWCRAGEDVAHQLPRDAGSCLATQTFLKGQTGISMLLQMDNTTAVAYINNLGGTVSPS